MILFSLKFVIANASLKAMKLIKEKKKKNLNGENPRLLFLDDGTGK